MFSFPVAGLSFAAGALGVLSPCVLPLLPIIAGAARNSRPGGAAILACGMLMTFTLVGFFVASIGFSFGIHQEMVAQSAGALLALSGVVLASQKLQDGLARALAPLSGRAALITAELPRNSAAGLFLLGGLLGAVWSPCTGPLLGTAISLAATQETYAQAFLMMFCYGAGSALPVFLVASFSRISIPRDGKARQVAAKSRKVFAWILIVTGLAIASQLDKAFEAAVLMYAPEELLDFITRY
jgi:cytochrome c-type biogenesis protein